MAATEEAPMSGVVNEPQTLDTKMDKTLDSSETHATSEDKLENGESSVTNGKDVEQASGQTLEEASELMEKGSTAMRAGDYAEAADCYSRAVEIRVAHYGELAPECSSSYYKYGCALLYKAQEEADPLGSVPKKDSSSVQSSEKDRMSQGACSESSEVGDDKQTNDSTQNSVEPDDEVNGDGEKDQEEADDDDDNEGNEDEDESDLDLAWKMLDLARAIVEKNPEDTMEKVDILSALGEVSLEREDIKNSLSDYSNALSILQRLVESDSRQIAELNFRICLVLEVGSQPEEAMRYCQEAISVCKARVQRLTDEVKNSTVSVAPKVSDDNQKVDLGPDVSHPDASAPGEEAEIETLNGLLGDLEKKYEDLQQLVLHPNPFLSEFLKMVAAKSAAGNGNSPAPNSSQMGMSSSGGGFDSPTLSTAHTKVSGDGAVKDLGVVGRGVKRVSLSSTSAESVPSKKPALEHDKDCAT